MCYWFGIVVKEEGYLIFYCLGIEDVIEEII